MNDIYSEIIDLLRSGRRGALATIVDVVGSSPRGLGSKYLVPESGPTTGTVGGGCLEARVWERAMDAISIMAELVKVRAKK